MDCQTARQWIELFPAGSRDWESAEGAALRDHLAQCRMCREVSDDVAEFDQQVAARLADVTVPDGLRDRLLSQLQRATLHAEPAQPSRRKSATRWVGLGLSLALAVAGGYWFTRPSQLTTTQLGDSGAEKLLGAKAPMTAFDGSFPARMSGSRWQGVVSPQAVGWDLDGRAGHDVAAFRVNIASLRFRGWLLMIPVNRVSDAPSHFEPVRLQYSRSAVWRDQDFVYVCLAEQGSIEDLIDQWGPGAA